MIFKIVPLLLLVAASCQALSFSHVGCYKDGEQDRVFPVFLGYKQKDDCAALVYAKGYKAFGLQNGGECWSGPNTDKSYNKYGVSSNCKGGKGGAWANDVYMIKAKLECPAGVTPNNAIKNCKTLKAENDKATSGIYWMNPTGEKDKAFQGYCDMETAGGGWTLVYSYTFTNYNNFGHGSNAITPQPDWPAVGNMPRSTEPPLSETHYAAMHFNLWKQIGSEFMIKSNINHWIKCTESGGSLLNWRTGPISCQVVKNVASQCHGYVPDRIEFVAAGSRGKDLGPDLVRSSSSTRLKEYYYLEASTQTGNWPTHDPCGTNAKKHVMGVANPHGNIYVR